MTRWNGSRLASALVALVFLAGCGSNLATEEQEVLDFVRGSGGEVVIEEGHIVRVDLNGTAVTGADLQQLRVLSQLREIVVYSTSVGDDVLEAVSPISTLNQLDISGTKVTQDAANQFQQDHPHVAIAGPGV